MGYGKKSNYFFDLESGDQWLRDGLVVIPIGGRVRISERERGNNVGGIYNIDLVIPTIPNFRDATTEYSSIVGLAR